MKTQTNIKIPIPDDNLDFDSIDLSSLTAIQLFKDSEKENSDIVPVKFSDKFKQKYSDFMTFNSDGSVCLIFGQKYK